MPKRTEEEEEESPVFDFEYLTAALNLIPLPGDEAAFAKNYVSSLEYEEKDEEWTLHLHSGEEFTLSDEDMSELEKILRGQAKKLYDRQVEAYQADLKAQAEAAAAFNAGVIPASKRFSN